MGRPAPGGAVEAPSGVDRETDDPAADELDDVARGVEELRAAIRAEAVDAGLPPPGEEGTSTGGGPHVAGASAAGESASRDGDSVSGGGGGGGDYGDSGDAGDKWQVGESARPPFADASDNPHRATATHDDAATDDAVDGDGADGVMSLLERSLPYPALVRLRLPASRRRPRGGDGGGGDGDGAESPLVAAVFVVEEGVVPGVSESDDSPPTSDGGATEVDAPWVSLHGRDLLVAVPFDVLAQADLASVAVTVGDRTFESVHLDALLPDWVSAVAAANGRNARVETENGGTEGDGPGGAGGRGGPDDLGEGVDGSHGNADGGILFGAPRLLREVDPVAEAAARHVLRGEELWDSGQNYPGAMEEFAVAAELGSPGAAVSLAAVLLAGVSVPAGSAGVGGTAFSSGPSFLIRRDLRRATSLLVNATARTGHPDAHALLGLVYAAGLDFEPESSDDGDTPAGVPPARVPRSALAIMHWSVAAASGNPLAQMALASRHLHGVDMPQSCDAAADLYAAAARTVVTDYLPSWDAPPRPPLPKHLHVSERVRLTEAEARSAASGGGSFRDRLSEEDEIVAYYSHAAAHGDEAALVHLAAMALAGVHGVPQDEARAAELLGRATAGGSAEAAARLGLLHLTQGKNDSALVHLLEADEKGHSLGSLGVGLAYLHGLYQGDPPASVTEGARSSTATPFGAAAPSGVDAVDGDASNSQTEAAAAGAAESRALSDWMDAQAVKYLEKAADMLQPDANYILALLYRDGRGVKPDSAKRYRHLQTASAFYDLRATYELGLMLLRGEPPAARDCTAAVKRLKLVAEEGEWNSVLGLALDALDAGDVGGGLYRYVQAAHAGIELAQYNAGLLYELGFVVDDEERAAAARRSRGGGDSSPPSPPVAAAASERDKSDRTDPSTTATIDTASTDGGEPDDRPELRSEEGGLGRLTAAPSSVTDAPSVVPTAPPPTELSPILSPAPQHDVLVDRAMRLYHLSALQGHADSLLRIGDLSYMVLRDYAAASTAYERAGKMGSAEALFNLGLMYARGVVGEAPDYALAKRYLDFARAADVNAVLPASLAVWVLRQVTAVRSGVAALRTAGRRLAALRDRHLRGWPAVGVPAAGGGNERGGVLLGPADRGCSRGKMRTCYLLGLWPPCWRASSSSASDGSWHDSAAAAMQKRRAVGVRGRLIHARPWQGGQKGRSASG
ncbi:hypothetical protein MMPV_000814 [Pyropia vietnamensis]